MEGNPNEPKLTGISLLRIGVYVVGGLTVAGFLWSSLNANATAKLLRNGSKSVTTTHTNLPTYVDYLSSRSLRRKEKGNRAFVKDDYKTAIRHYTKAIEFDPAMTIALFNRAMAHMQANQMEKTVSDCLQVLLLLEGRNCREPIVSRCYSLVAKVFGADGRIEATEFNRCAQQYKVSKEVPQKVGWRMVCHNSKPKKCEDDGNVENMAEHVSIVHTETGRALVAQRDFHEGDVIFTEIPFANVLSLDAEDQSCCDFCLQLLRKEEGDSVVSCPKCSREYYCSSACQALAWVRYHRVLCPKTVKGSEELVEQLEEEETALKFLQERREKKSKQAAEDKTEKPRAGLTSSAAQMPSEHPILQLEQKCIESRSGHHLLLARVLARFVQLGSERQIKEWHSDLVSLPANAAVEKNAYADDIEPLLQFLNPALVDSLSLHSILEKMQGSLLFGIPDEGSSPSSMKGNGFYLIASAVSHGGVPNAAFRFLHSNHQLSCVAMKDISMGEMIVTSFPTSPQSNTKEE